MPTPARPNREKRDAAFAHDPPLSIQSAASYITQEEGTQQTEGPGSAASEDQPCPAAPAVAIRVARGDKPGSRRRGPEPGGARQRRPANPMVAKSRYLVARQVAKVEPWLSGNATPLKDRFCQVEVG